MYSPSGPNGIVRVIATISRNQLQKEVSQNYFLESYVRCRVAQHGRVWRSLQPTRKIILGELISWKLRNLAAAAPQNNIKILWANYFRNIFARGGGGGVGARNGYHLSFWRSFPCFIAILGPI